MKIYLLILSLCLPQIAAAQNKTFKVRADKAFAEMDYVTAAYYYDKALENGALTAAGKVPYFSTKNRVDSSGVNELRYQLAESYRLYQNYTMAETLYKQVVEANESDYPLARLWYGLCLRCNNEPSKAVGQLELFISSNKDIKENKRYATIAANELKDCLFAIKQSKIATTAKIVKLENSFSI